MTIDPPREQKRKEEINWILDEVPENGITLAEEHIEAVHRGLSESVTEENPLDIDGESHADTIAEKAEKKVRRKARAVADESVAEEAGISAGESARHEVLRLIREESPRLNDTSE